MITYPRVCMSCKRIYNNRHTFSRHQKDTCQRTLSTLKQSIEKNADGHTEVPSQNTYINHQTNNYNVSIVVNENADLAKVQEIVQMPNFSVTKAQEQSLIKLKALMDEQKVCDREQFQGFIAFYTTTSDILLDEFDERRDLVEKINYYVQSGHLPVSGKYSAKLDEDVAFVEMRKFIPALAALFWKDIFLPDLERDILEKLAQRSVRMTNEKGDCQSRRSQDVYGEDQVPLTLEEYCRKYNHHDALDEDGQLIDSKLGDIAPRYTFYKDKIFWWANEHAPTMIVNHLVRISQTLCRVISLSNEIHTILSNSRVNKFAQKIVNNEDVITIPPRIIKDIQKSMIADSKTDLVSAWRLLTDAFAKAQNIQDPESTSGLRFKYMHDEVKAFRANRGM